LAPNEKLVTGVDVVQERTLLKAAHFLKFFTKQNLSALS